MRLRNILIGIICILLLVLAGIVIFVLSQTTTEERIDPLTGFSVLESGTAGGYAYSVYSYRGDGNITILSLTSEPKRKLTILNDSQAIEATRLSELVDNLKKLEPYGYNVTVSSEPRVGEGIYIVPTGAIPSYVLFNLQQNSSNSTIIYIGETDLLLSNGVKRFSWYNQLLPNQKQRIVRYNGTLDEFLKTSNVSLNSEILHSTWALKNSTTYRITGAGVGTATVPTNRIGYVRIIYDLKGLHGTYDSVRLQTVEHTITPSPQSIYPWERSALEYSLSRTNGTAFFTVKKNGKTVEHEQLLRVTDENVFIKKLQYSEPGDYILIVDDNSGVIATGLLHVKDIQIKPIDHRGYVYVFSAMVDGKPLEDTEVLVSLGNSSKKKYFVNDGTITITAKPNKGLNVFNFEIGSTTIPVTFDNRESTIFEFYLTYGIPALIFVIVVYFGARATKSPTYRLRFGDSADYVRQEIKLPLDRALESFRMIRNDMKLSKSPITPHEFSVSLKRYLTNGADVTEGNVEEILKKLVKAGHLEAHRDYYQLKGEGDVVRNVLQRMVREKLIESGTPFKETGRKFITKDFEIGFFGEVFSGKGIIIVDDKFEEKRLLEKLSESERVRLKIMQSNDMISIIPITRLSDFL
jgi:DNA-binding PadR family transcriptional regulator